MKARPMCSAQSKSATDSNPNRPGNPNEIGHPMLLKTATFSFFPGTGGRDIGMSGRIGLDFLV